MKKINKTQIVFLFYSSICCHQLFCYFYILNKPQRLIPRIINFRPKEHELLGKARWGRGNLTVQTAADLPASESSQKLVTSSDQGSNSREKSSKAQQRLSIDSPRAIAYKDSLPSRPPSLKIEQVPSSLQPLKEPSPQERGGEVKTTPSEHAELSRIRSASDSDPKSIRHSYDEKFEKPRRDVQYRPQKADAQNGRTDSLNEPVSSAPTVSNKEKSLSPPTPGSVEKRGMHGHNLTKFPLMVDTIKGYE